MSRTEFIQRAAIAALGQLAGKVARRNENEKNEELCADTCLAHALALAGAVERLAPFTSYSGYDDMVGQ